MNISTWQAELSVDSRCELGKARSGMPAAGGFTGAISWANACTGTPPPRRRAVITCWIKKSRLPPRLTMVACCWSVSIH